jgi:hypothetical protein
MRGLVDYDSTPMQTLRSYGLRDELELMFDEYCVYQSLLSISQSLRYKYMLSYRGTSMQDTVTPMIMVVRKMII